MKRKLQVIIRATAVSVMAFSALAQDISNPNKTGQNYARDQTIYSGRTDRLNDTAKASDIIGMTVRNYQHEKLGKVADIAVDVQSGRIVQVIISTGGFCNLTEIPHIFRILSIK